MIKEYKIGYTTPNYTYINITEKGMKNKYRKIAKMCAMITKANKKNKYLYTIMVVTKKVEEIITLIEN